MLHCAAVAHPSVSGPIRPDPVEIRRTLEPRPAPRAEGRAARRTPESDLRLPRPFLKWAGGKRQLLPDLRACYPRAFARYYEPFLGSGAVFFDLAASGALSGRDAILSDMNLDVIGCYTALRRDAATVLRHLAALADAHRLTPERHYYDVRDGRFNPLRRRVMAGRPSGKRAPRYPPELAAMLIYLNRTGFNGLFRLNSRGAFNVPAGRYANPRICDAPTLRAAARALAGPAVTLRGAPFDEVLAGARRDDFVYLDPPYAPLSATSSFTGYTEGGFGADDQRRLRDVVVGLAERGCHVLLSNSTAPLIRDLYEHDRRVAEAGLRTYRVRARRAINARGARRGHVDEFLITNVPRRHGRQA